MAEKVVLVCDVCGEPAAESASIKVGRRSLRKDLCDTHLRELAAGARPARPGRRKATAKASSRKSPTRGKKSPARRSKSTRRKAQAPAPTEGR